MQTPIAHYNTSLMTDKRPKGRPRKFKEDRVLVTLRITKKDAALMDLLCEITGVARADILETMFQTHIQKDRIMEIAERAKQAS